MTLLELSERVGRRRRQKASRRRARYQLARSLGASSGEADVLSRWSEGNIKVLMNEKKKGGKARPIISRKGPGKQEALF